MKGKSKLEMQINLCGRQTFIQVKGKVDDNTGYQ